MQINTVKLKSKRKAKKSVGRGGKKGTYCGRGGKGQTARSGSSINPLFEGGRSSLIDRMKKIRGFKSHALKLEVKLSQIEKKYVDGETVDIKSLLEKKLIKEANRRVIIKIVKDQDKFSKKLTFAKNVAFTASVKGIIEK